MKVRPLLALLIVASAATGCRSHQLRNDQDHIRSAVLDLHSSQIMDNLVRVRNRQPILHVDYIHMTGTISQTATGTVNGSHGVTRTSNALFAGVAPVASTLANIRQMVNGATLGGGAGQTNQLTVTAEPVVNNPEVYNAYLEFMKDESRLVESATPPCPGEAVAVKCVEVHDECAPCGWRGWFKQHHTRLVYYWVPQGHRDEFFRLALYVVAVRSDASPASPYFEVGVVGTEKVRHIAGGAYELTILIDKKIPNDDGYLVANIRGLVFGQVNDLRFSYDDSEGKKRADPNARILTEDQKTDRFRVKLNLEDLNKRLAADPAAPKIEIKDVVADLKGQRVKLRLEGFIPGGTRTDRLLEDIRHQLELQRLNQFPGP